MPANASNGPIRCADGLGGLDSPGVANPPPTARNGHWFDAVVILALACLVVVGRAPYLNTFDFLGKDGPLYVDALRLDADFDVPMPGNLGYVLLGKAANLIWTNPVTAYLVVNVGLTIIGAAFTYLFGAMIVSRGLAAAAALAMICSPMVWWHGGAIASYPVWLATLPAVGWFGLRYQRRGEGLGDLLGMSVSLGLGMTLRPDLLVFGGPLWAGCLLLGRAPMRHWLIGLAILAAACGTWFFGTAWVLGGVDVYLGRVQAKHEGDREGFSLFARGLFEGLGRNVVKYILFLAWASLLLIPPFLVGLVKTIQDRRWRGLAIALLWVGPSWAFSFLIFAGNAGLIFPFLPLLYLGAAIGLKTISGEARATVAMVGLAILSTMQFTQTKMRPQYNQRDVILNVTFLRYSAEGLKLRYNFNLDDFGVSPDLTDVHRQMKKPEPFPALPELAPEQSLPR